MLSPLVIAHRINKSHQLKEVPKELGVELDIRAHGDRLILHHDPFLGGEDFEDYIEHYDHKFLIVNIKEAGIEQRVMALLEKAGIEEYFFLDVEFPFIYRAAREGFRKIAMRYSEDESIETALKYDHLIDWLWIDTNTKLPIDETNKSLLQRFKTCLVCPERWGREEDIKSYQRTIKDLNFKLDAVMTDLRFAEEWAL